MTINKRKKNYKLRRRVKRTIASITLVMAVVVAAIPVENYGSMEASGIAGDVKLLEEADKYLLSNNELKESLKKYDSTNYENVFSDSKVKTVQHIEGDSFIDAYEVWLDSNGSSAMIAKSVFAKDREKFDIYETEYYDYVQMDDSYITAVNTAFASEEYSLKYGATKKDYTKTSLTVTLADGTTETRTVTPTSATTMSVDSPTASVQSGVTTGISYTDAKGINKYTKNSGTAPNAEDILTKYAPSSLEAYLDTLSTYNDELKAFTDVLDRIDAAATHTEQDVTDWENAVTGIGGLTVPSDTFSMTYEKIRSDESQVDEDGNGLQDIIDYTICQRLESQESNGGDLERYELKRLTNEAGRIVYIPVNVSGLGPMGSQENDNNDYLTSGKVTIKGIKSDAFNPKEDHTPDNYGEIGVLTIPGSVEFIGANAFANCKNLKDVTINDDKCSILGDEAFSGCVKLSSVKFTSANSKLETVGCMAFYNTLLSDIVFPENVKLIGAGCLYYSGISSMTMGGLRNDTLTIEPYAFFGCDKLSAVNFAGENTNFKMGEAIFALTANQSGGALENFAFPSYMNQIVYEDEKDVLLESDYILAGRENLKTVTFPGRMGNGAKNKLIPDHTLAGCTALEYVVFPENAYDADYVPGELFREVMNSEFYVRGPEHGASRDTKATPRQRTWRAVPGYKLENGEPGVIPYMFTDDAGVEHIEIGVGQENRDDYIATIDIVDEKTAILSGYEENNKSEFDSIAVEIPAMVGKYTITEIADNCFGDDVKNKIYKVIITDGTVQKINASAFENCKKLQWVELGDSVTFIGENAFAGCNSLENVIFSQTKTGLYGDDDTYWEEALEIEENAFKTGSDFLIFHGAVHPSYAPFKLAMSAEGKNMTGTSVQICYKTDAPTNLTILRDNTTGESTLIDYPHYEEIDVVNAEILKKWANGDSGYSITDKFEEWSGLRGTTNYIDRPYNINNYYSEEDVVLYTLFMNIPKGVESIDANAYYNNSANASDIAYLSRTYTPETKKSSKTGKEIEVAINGSDNAQRNLNNVLTYGKYSDVKNVYSGKDYIAPSDLDELGVTAGLFSGFLAESSFSGTVAKLTAPDDTTSGVIWRTYNGHAYVENSIIGNDNLTTIDLKSVKSLPDYAFMSCENLLKTSYGEEMQEIGALPYRNCRSLTQIDIPATNKYVLFGNMILYTTNKTNEQGATGLEIVECLEGRGNNGTNNSSFKVGVDSGDENLADVVSIAKEAFSYCDEITEADLSTTAITTLPERCFYKATKLDTVKLPETIAVIGAEAFLDTSSNRIEVTIPNPQCAIGETAFNLASGQKVTIRGPQYDSTGTRNSAIYNYYLKMKAIYDNIEFIGEDKHKVTFIDYDTSTLKDPQVANPQYVSHGEDAICLPEPSRSGYKFSTWKCILADGTQFTGTGDPWKNVTEDRIIQAVYTPDASIVEPDGNEYTLTIENGTANGATGSITAKGGDRITIVADTKTDGSKFQYWSVDPKGHTNLFVDGLTANSTVFVMPNENVKVTANFSKDGSSGGNKPGDGDDDDNKKKYKLTVNYGSGTGEYKAGETVTISAFAPDSSSKVFSKWTSNSTNLGFANATSSTTTIVMPESDVTVTANYKTRVGSDDDDDDDDDDRTPSRRPGTSTSTTTVTNRPSNSATTTTGTTGTVTNSTGTADNNGNKIYITKNGVSNKDVASITVDGSTDNFIVRISESAEATAAVEESLINKYGSLDGLAYFPMDISLYDSTGQNKITDTYGLNITVTMPIPDVLIQYGGNARVAACDNGNLQQLTPRFTTIDGIACISFVPPHFSPYVIYVDTNNLIAGQTLDQTPSTGDPIHPKWFLATGMACLSIILFATSDSRKKRNFKTA